MSLQLLIQSSQDALADCLRQIERAQDVLGEIETGGDEPPLSQAELERARSQCRGLERTLADLARKLG